MIKKNSKENYITFIDLEHILRSPSPQPLLPKAKGYCVCITFQTQRYLCLYYFYLLLCTYTFIAMEQYNI